MCVNVRNGGFDGKASVKIYGKADSLQVQALSGQIQKCAVQQELTMTEFGLHIITPMIHGEAGLNTTVWYGGDMYVLFEKSCDAIRKPYHCDENLCEGGCYLWAMLLNMRLNGHRKYDKIARENLDIIMGKGNMSEKKRFHLWRWKAIPRIISTRRVECKSSFSAYLFCWKLTGSMAMRRI